MPYARRQLLSPQPMQPCGSRHAHLTTYNNQRDDAEKVNFNKLNPFRTLAIKLIIAHRVKRIPCSSRGIVHLPLLSVVATGGEHGCEPVPERSGEAREGGGGANGGVSEALQKIRYPLRNA